MTYTFKCSNHKTPLFSYIVQSMADKLEAPKCLECKESMKRVWDAPPVTWMGTGWGKDAR